MKKLLIVKVIESRKNAGNYILTLIDGTACYVNHPMLEGHFALFTPANDGWRTMLNGDLEVDEESSRACDELGKVLVARLGGGF